MSKSLKNIYTLQDILDKGYSIEAFKLVVLSKNYHTEGNFTWEIMDAAQNRLQELYAWADRRHQPTIDTMPEELDLLWKETLEGIDAKLQDNLDTSGALAVLAKIINWMKEKPIPQVDGKYSDGALAKIDRLLGLKLDGRPDITDEQKSILNARLLARTNKDWAKSDELRDSLENQGIGIRDSQVGQIWYRIQVI